MSAVGNRRSWGSPANVIDRLTGRWSVKRSIDGKGTDQGSLDGIATFRSLEDGSLSYHEEGRLCLSNGHEFNAQRDYVYDKLAAGFAVFFNETPRRLFHEVHLSAEETGTLSGQTEHLCGKDLYLTKYRFAPDGRFVVSHEVRGPRKDYTMTTWYERIANHESDRE